MILLTYGDFEVFDTPICFIYGIYTFYPIYLNIPFEFRHFRKTFSKLQHFWSTQYFRFMVLSLFWIKLERIFFFSLNKNANFHFYFFSYFFFSKLLKTNRSPAENWKHCPWLISPCTHIECFGQCANNIRMKCKNTYSLSFWNTHRDVLSYLLLD